MTPASFTVQIRSAVDEATASYWSDAADIYPAMWEAEYELAADIGVTQYNTSTTTVTDTSQYTKPANTLRIEKVLWNGVKLKKIDIVDYETIAGTSYGGTIATGNPVYYYEYGNVIGLYPIPNAAQTLRWSVVKRPAEITTSSTQFTVDEEFQPSIKNYVLYQMFLKDNDGRSENYRQKWEADKGRLRSVFNTRMYLDQNMEVKDVNLMNSTDWGII